MSLYGPKQDARMAVRVAVRAGRMTPVTALTCTDCGEPAQQYDHYLGYEPEHYLSVQAVCRRCHGQRTKAHRHPEPLRLLPPRTRLSPRELQVLGLAAAGGTLQEIAAALNVSPKTVSNQLLSASNKLGAANRTQAVAIALQDGLLAAHRTGAAA